MKKVKIDSNVKVLAWDLDGTIIDSFRVVKEIVNEIALDRGIEPPTAEVLAKNFHGTMSETLGALLGVTNTEEEVEELYASFLTKQERFYESLAEHFIEDAMDLVHRAKKAGLTQILVTNRNHARTGNASPYHIVANSDLKDVIEMIFAGDEVEVRKPDPGMLVSYLAKKKWQPENLVVIGDQFVDGQLAMNLGSKAILVNRENDEIAHLDQLGTGWEEHVLVVKTLHDVQL